MNGIFKKEIDRLEKEASDSLERLLQAWAGVGAGAMMHGDREALAEVEVGLNRVKLAIGALSAKNPTAGTVTLGGG